MAQKYIQPIADMTQAYKSFTNHLMKSEEKIICSLGNSHFNEFVHNGLFKNAFAVLSDYRLYIKGKRLSSHRGKRYKTTETDHIVDIKDITGTGYAKIFDKKYLIHVAISAGAILAFLFMSYQSMQG